MQEPSRAEGFSCKHCGVACPDMPSLLEHADFCGQSDEDRRFRCDECGRGYRHAGSLANHKKTHDVGSFQCHVCSRRLSNALALKSHLRIHTSRKKHSCEECGKAFRLAAQLSTHQKVHRNRDLRGRTRASEAERNRARGVCRFQPLRPADDPGFDPASENGLGDAPRSDRVARSAAEGDAPGEDGDRPFRCDMCDKSYRHNASLINHRKTHQMGIFECPVCFKQLNNLAALSSHQRTHSKTRSRPSMVAPGTPEPQPGSEATQNGAADVLFCQLCQMAFACEDDFQNHVILHNSSSVSFELPASTPEDQHFSYDHSITQSPDSSQYPPSSDTPPLPPLLDGAVDYDHAHGPMENGHVYVPHPVDDDPSTSDTQGEDADRLPRGADPGASARAPDDGRQEEAGGSDRRFKCHVCGKTYRHAGSLINHKRSHQTGVFQCTICRKNYPHLAALRSHLRIHKGRPTLLATSAEGDWLSSEPLTHESHLGGFAGQDGDDHALELPQDLDEGAYADSDSENADDLGEAGFHERYDGSFDEGRHRDDPPRDETPTERHMCADCGETFADIAGIKSHTCPLLSPYRSERREIDFKGDYKQALGGAAERFVFDGPDEGAYFSGPDVHGTMHEQMLSDGEKEPFKEGEEDEEEDDDDDEEMYQCSVCGDHYSSMRALRSHLRGHTQTIRTSSPSGPSSTSSLEPEKDEEPGRLQQGLIICSTCGESFTQRQDLQAHQMLHADEDEKPPEQYVLQDPGGLRPKEEIESIICGKCGVFFTSVHHLENHPCPEHADENLDACDLKPDPVGAPGRDLERPRESPGNAERLYRCDQCGRSYRHAGSLLNHKKSHKTGVFRCFICQKRFYNLLALKNHQRTHFDVKKHSCTECGKAFKIHKQLVNHQRVHQENKAKIEELNKQIQTLMEMSGNVSVGGVHPLHANKRRSSRRHRQKDTSESELSSPEKDAHAARPNDPRPFVCDQCGRSYRHAGSLVNHKNSHKTGEYYCAICNNTYSNQLAMKNHLRTHFSAKKHCCTDCGRSFRGKKQLLNHVCRHNRKAASALRVKRKGRRRPKDLTCKDCRLAFPTAELLVGHSCSTSSKEPGLKSVAAGPGPDLGAAAPKIKEERPFRCNVCGRSYRHAGSLLNHKNTHKTGHFSCSFCAKPFSNPMALRNHTRIHTQKKKYVCPTCGKAFRLSSILYNHQKVHARGVTLHTCQTCGKRFKGRSGLKRHSCYRNGASSSPVSQDAGDKCYTCDQCGRSYRHAGSLLNHKKTHSADLLNCSLCLKTFADPQELQSHLQMARHCCPDCGKTFCEYAHLQSHMEVHSKGLPYYCDACQQNFPNMASFQQHRELHRAAQEPSPRHPAAPVPPALSWVSQADQQAALPGLPGLHPEFGPVRKGFPEPPEPPPQEDGDAGEKSHVCEHCGRSYRHAGSLLNHKNSHKTGSFYCSVCQKEFTNLMALKNHRRIHVEPKRYQCVECGKAFRVSTQLICHRRIHTKEKPFSCLLCEKRFSSKSNLRHHQKLHQNAQRSFESSFSMDPDGFMDLGADPFL